jgi:hypothetical protein
VSDKVDQRADALEKKYGRGPTYSLSEHSLILDGVVPEWLLRGRRLLTGDLRERCDQLIKMLQRAHAQVHPLVRDNEGSSDT